MEEIKVREDLNDMVKSIGFSHNKTKFGYVNICNVKLFNDVVIEFRDNDKVFELLQSYSALGDKDFIKSRSLVEEYKLDDTGEKVGTYVCVKYELTDGTIIRMFPNSFNVSKSIDNYYKLFKQTMKVKSKQ